MGNGAMVHHPEGSGMVAPHRELAAQVERALIVGDLSQLAPEQRVDLYNTTCRSLGLWGTRAWTC